MLWVCWSFKCVLINVTYTCLWFFVVNNLFSFRLFINYLQPILRLSWSCGALSKDLPDKSWIDKEVCVMFMCCYWSHDPLAWSDWLSCYWLEQWWIRSCNHTSPMFPSTSSLWWIITYMEWITSMSVLSNSEFPVPSVILHSNVLYTLYM